MGDIRKPELVDFTDQVVEFEEIVERANRKALKLHIKLNDTAQGFTYISLDRVHVIEAALDYCLEQVEALAEPVDDVPK